MESLQVQYKQLNDTKLKLLDAVILLNINLSEINNNYISSTCSLSPGIIVLAPRLYLYIDKYINVRQLINLLIQGFMKAPCAATLQL